MNVDALRALEKAVEAEKRCIMPTPHYSVEARKRGLTARIMGYVEGYAVCRHPGAAPFCISVNDVKKHIHTLIAQMEAKKEEEGDDAWE